MSWWWCLNHSRPEQDPNVDAGAADKLGPYETEEAAAGWREQFEARNEQVGPRGPGGNDRKGRTLTPDRRQDRRGWRYDAVLLVSFGGPEGPGDVMPFLRNVTAGRDVPDERLAEVAEHYEPLRRGQPDQRPEPRAAGRVAGRAGAPRRLLGQSQLGSLPARDAAQMRADGVRRAAVFVTAAYASYSSCRQYREDLAAAHPGELQLDKLRHYYNHPGFIAAQTEQVVALGERWCPTPGWSSPRIRSRVASARTSGPTGGAYPAQLAEAAALVAAQVRERTGWRGEFEVAWQSRSGPPSVPWLEPDINDRLEPLAPRAYATSSRSRSASSAIMSRCATTSTSRRRRRPRGSASDSSARARSGPAGRSSRWCVNSSRSAKPGTDASARARDGRTEPRRVPARLLPGRVPRPAAAGDPRDMQPPVESATRGSR